MSHWGFHVSNHHPITSSHDYGHNTISCCPVNNGRLQYVVKNDSSLAETMISQTSIIPTANLSKEIASVPHTFPLAQLRRDSTVPHMIGCETFLKLNGCTISS